MNDGREHFGSLVVVLLLSLVSLSSRICPQVKSSDSNPANGSLLGRPVVYTAQG